MALTAQEIREQLRQKKLATQNNLPVPVLAEPKPVRDRSSVGEARESTDHMGSMAPIRKPDSRGGQKLFYKEHSTANVRHQQPPYSAIAEKSVLACILKAPAKVIPIAQQALGADYFFEPRHQQLFTDACAFFNDQGMFDLPTLTTHLIDVGHIGQVGGPAYVTELAIDFGAIPENVSYYLDIVKERHARRSIIKAGTEAVRRAYALAETDQAVDIFDDLFTGLEIARTGLQSNLRLPALCDISLFLNGNQPPMPAELVKGIVHQGSKIVVGGTSKGRKTMALIDLSVSVASGRPWWGFETVQGPVCYINFEIQDPFFAYRTHVVCQAKNVKLDRESFMVWNLRGHGEGLEHLSHDLMAVLRHKKFVLIVFDPIYKGLGSRDENKAGDVASMMNELEKIAVKTGAAIAFGAHYSKGNQAMKESIDRIGGSGVFARDPDSILTMTAHEEEEAFTVDATLRNFAPIEPFVVKFSWPLFTRDEELDPEDLKPARGSTSGQYKVKYTDEMLLDNLSVIDPVAVTALKKLVNERHGMQKTEFYRRKDRLISEKQIAQKGDDLFRVPRSEQ